MDTATIDLAAADDLTLVQRAAAGHVGAFDVLMQRHNQRLYRAARGILRDEAEAEEAVQDAWWKAYQHLREFRGDASPLTWLTRIAINEALMRQRQNKTHAGRIQAYGSDEEADQIIAAQGDTMTLIRPAQPDQLASDTELRRLIEARIDELPDRYRAVFMLRGVEGLSFAEIAAILHLSQTTARMRFMRARGLMRKALQQDIDLSAGDAFSFAGERCDRIVAGVHARMRAAGIAEA